MSDLKRESDKILYQLIQQLQDFREIDADWKVRHDNSAQEFRKTILIDTERMKKDIAKLMVPYRFISWLGGLIMAEVCIRYFGALVDWMKVRMK